MSYPKYLEDYSTSDLLDEIDRRYEHTKNKLCPYCSQKIIKHTYSKRAKYLTSYHDDNALKNWLMAKILTK